MADRLQTSSHLAAERAGMTFDQYAYFGNLQEHEAPGAHRNHLYEDIDFSTIIKSHIGCSHQETRKSNSLQSSLPSQANPMLPRAPTTWKSRFVKPSVAKRNSDRPQYIETKEFTNNDQPSWRRPSADAPVQSEESRVNGAPGSKTRPYTAKGSLSSPVAPISTRGSKQSSLAASEKGSLCSGGRSLKNSLSERASTTSQGMPRERPFDRRAGDVVRGPIARRDPPVKSPIPPLESASRPLRGGASPGWNREPLPPPPSATRLFPEPALDPLAPDEEEPRIAHTAPFSPASPLSHGSTSSAVSSFHLNYPNAPMGGEQPPLPARMEAGWRPQTPPVAEKASPSVSSPPYAARRNSGDARVVDETPKRKEFILQVERRSVGLLSSKAPSPPGLLERLTYPRLKSNKQTQMEEAEELKQEVAKRRASAKKNAQITALLQYKWTTPAPSFSLRDLEYQNELYAC